MDEGRGQGVTRVLEALELRDADQAAAIVARCPAIDAGAGEPHFRSSLPPSALLLVDEGFCVLRIPRPDAARSIITCEAGPGSVLLPPTDAEVLFGLTESRLIAIPQEEVDRLLRLPSVARMLLDQLATSLGHKQEAIGNFADTRHLERVRRKLLQLARSYGRVSRDGIRIDFPLSHALLAEMIGSSRETVTRALDELQRSGFVVRRGHKYRLLISPREV
jgi:CRP/FNR family transcriptional regulator, cyclic AMP receptor protein